MTGQSQTRSGELVATRAFRDGASAAADLSNVIPFARARRTGAGSYAPPASYAPPVIVKPADRPAPLPRSTKPWLQALLVMCSLLLHGGMLYLFWQEPQPLAGIGTEAITVEIEIGDSRPAGVAPKVATDQVDMAPANEVKPDDKATEDKATETREVKPEEMRTEVAKEQPVEQPKEQKPDERQQIAMVETQQAEVPTVRPRETPPDMQAVISPPREQPQELKPVEPQQKPSEPSPAQEATSGVGSISVSAMANYNGRVSAHLKRHQQYPAGARNRGIVGKGIISFSIDGGGHVTSASVVTTSGSAPLDQEMTAMALRASPFPAPPDGQPKKFTAPVTFELK